MKKCFVALFFAFCVCISVSAFENKYVSDKWDVSFDIPLYFEEKPLEAADVSDAVFESTKTGNRFSFGVVDVWEKLSEKEKEGYSRSDFSHSKITEEDIRMAVGATNSRTPSLTGYTSSAGLSIIDVCEVEYGGVDYYKMTCEYSKGNSVFGNVKANLTYLLRCDMGIMYMFIYETDFERSYDFEDFEETLKSVDYPQIEDEKVSVSLGTYMEFILPIAFFLIMIAAAIILIVKVKF